MQARILPGRGSGGRSRTSASGRASPSRAMRSSGARRPSKPSMIACMVSWGVAPAGTAAAMSTTPRSVNRPGRMSAPAEDWNSTSFMASSGPARALDLVGGVAEGAEDPVVEPGPAGLREEVRVHVLPDDLAGGRDLEDPAVAALADQRVAVGQALGARDVRAEEVEERLVVVLPDDRARARVDLDHARVGRRVIAAVRAVVEDQDVAVGQGTRVVLLGQRWAAELPGDSPGGPVDDRDGGDVAEAHQQIAVRHLGHRVGVGSTPPADLAA